MGWVWVDLIQILGTRPFACFDAALCFMSETRDGCLSFLCYGMIRGPAIFVDPRSFVR